jgi:Phospholipase A2-like domain
MVKRTRARPHTNTQKGGGFLSSLGEIGLAGVGGLAGVDNRINPLFDGELHGIIQLPSGKKSRAQYMGPGTALKQRVTRGDPGLSSVDRASKAHDIRYSLARNNGDIDRADDIMLRAIDSHPDLPFNKLQARLIWPKRQLAKLGFRTGSGFGDPNLDNDPALLNKYRSTLAGLQQQGYGHGR